MTHTVVIIGTLDTKGPEVAYLRDRLEALGLCTTVIDVGILNEPLGITPDISRAEVATYGGTTIEALRNAGSRGRAVHGMREALKGLVRRLYADGKLDAGWCSLLAVSRVCREYSYCPAGRPKST